MATFNRASSSLPLDNTLHSRAIRDLGGWPTNTIQYPRHSGVTVHAKTYRTAHAQQNAVANKTISINVVIWQQFRSIHTCIIMAAIKNKNWSRARKPVQQLTSRFKSSYHCIIIVSDLIVIRMQHDTVTLIIEATFTHTYTAEKWGRNCNLYKTSNTCTWVKRAGAGKPISSPSEKCSCRQT